ncbi:multidrug effflux MFS transporter [Cryobacterium arcticum]|uniref:multidrug effflux MFS transporter n=1 Tax=Cryobacterium arcticum TaxID=670052 RepID=UPI0015E8663C|nr:multidrug effflux MFS transporter [Cryobacterium arcticum]
MNERFAADAPFRARRATRAAATDPRSPGAAVERSSGDHPAVAGPPTGPVSVLFESGLAAGGAPPAGRSGPAGRSLAVLIVALGLLGAIWPLTMDLYLPSFVQLEGDFGTTASNVQLTLTAAFIGMGLGQLVAGPISDAVGRTRPLGVAVLLYCLASLACALAPTITLLIGARFLQGMTSAACAVISIAIVRDVAVGDRMLILSARLSLVSGVFVVGSPALGAQLLTIMNWRGLFWTLVCYGLLLVVIVAAVLMRHETNPPARRALRRTVRLRDDYRALAAERQFRAVVLGGGLLFGGMMAYMASSSFLFQGVFELTPTGYAIVFGGHGVLMILGAQVGARLARAFTPQRILFLGLAGLVGSAVLLLGSVALLPQLGLWGFLGPLLGFVTAFGLTNPALSTVALAPHGLRAGTAASVLGASNMAFAACLAPLAGHFGVQTPVPTAAIMVVAATTAATVFAVGFRRARVRSSRAHP